MISDRLKRFFVRTAEKLAERFYEGPEMPSRFSVMAESFAVLHPKATRGEWLKMSEELARNAYRAGFQRGYENAERDPAEPDVAPEEIADVLSPGWRDRAHDWSWATSLPIPTDLDRIPEDDLGAASFIGDGDDRKALFDRDR